MADNLRTLREIRLTLLEELNDLYDREEIQSLSNIVIREATGIKSLHELYNPDHNLTSRQASAIKKMCSELKTGKPVQYVLGKTDFYSYTFMLNEATLIPRPETEELVDLIIKENSGFEGNIIDVGSGSGCISVVLALNLTRSKVTGIDISPAAVMISKENAILNKAKITFIEADITKFDPSGLNKAGIIVSNPPYVMESEKVAMKNNVLDFEPHTALFVPDSDPLVFYIRILDMAKEILHGNGKIYFEINEAMGSEMKKLLERYGYAHIEIVRDINGKDRIAKAIKNG